MKVTILIASLLGVFLAPALANWNGEKDFDGENSYNSFTNSNEGIDSNEGINSNEGIGSNDGIGLNYGIRSNEGTNTWKSVWDIKTGYVATKVFSKHTCIIAKMDRRVLLDGWLPALPEGPKEPGLQLPPTENRFIISTNRLYSLLPYGKLIQDLCRGIPSYLAYPAAGSNFLEGHDSCLKVKINKADVYYCNYS